MTKFATKTISGTGRGKSLGYPTINMVVPEKIPLILHQGIYTAHAKINDEKYNGILTYGPNPTFGEKTVTLSIYLLDTVAPTVYPNTDIEIEIGKPIRKIEEFNLPEELIQQMQKDEITARALLQS